MRFKFADDGLRRLYTLGAGAGKLPDEVVTTFLLRIRHVEAAKDERDLRQPPSVHYEQLKAKAYRDKASLRLDPRWRLILSVEEDGDGKFVLMHEITNHYGG